MKKRNHLKTYTLVGLTAAAAVIAVGWDGLIAGPGQSESPFRPFTEDFMLETCTFTDTGKNPFFSLVPGDELVLVGVEDKEELEVVITVLSDTRQVTVDGIGTISTRVVQELESVDGELAEISKNFFAICEETNSVFYFGEDVDIYEDGEIVSHDGAWEAGVDGALPGLVMPGTFLLGARYFQEMAPDVAMDRAENAAMNLTIEVPAGTFQNSVMIFETSSLASSDRSIKFYAPGIGLIVDETVRLVEYDVAP